MDVSEREVQAEARKKSSRTSFVSISNSFVERVEQMDRTILVPTKLIDIDCKEDPLIPAIVQNGTSNLFEVYTVIKQFKEKLVSMDLDDEQLGTISPYEVDDSLRQFNSLDSGHWSTNSSNGSVHSEEEGSYSSDNELSEVNYRVKRSLHSAKGMSAFLIQLFELSDYVVHRYCVEFECDKLA